MQQVSRCRAVALGFAAFAILFSSVFAQAPDPGPLKCSIDGRPVPCGNSVPPPPPPPDDGRRAPSARELHVRAYNNGLALYNQQKWREAEDAFRRALELLPGDPSSNYMLGASITGDLYSRWKFLSELGLSQEGYGDDLEDRLEAAIDAFFFAAEAGDADARRALARARASLAEFRAAREARRIANRNREEAEKPFLAAYGRGRDLFEQRRWTEAEAAFRTAIAVKPGFVDADTYYWLALSLHNQRKLEDAVAAYEEVLRRQPAPREAEGTREYLPWAKATLAQRANDSKTTEAYARQVIAANPENAAAHGMLGWALNEQLRPRDAERELRESLRLDPAALRPRRDLARTLDAMGDRDGAMREAHEAWRRDPSDRNNVSLLETFIYNHSLPHLAVEDYPAAERVLRQGLADLPQSVQTQVALGDVLKRHADTVRGREPAAAQALYGEAVSSYREALRLSPGDREAAAGLERAIAGEAAARISGSLVALTPFPPGGPANVRVGPPGAASGGPAPRTPTEQLESAAAGGTSAKREAARAAAETEQQTIEVLNAGRERAVADARRVFDLPGGRQSPQVEWPTLEGPQFRDPEIPAHLRNDPAIQQLVVKREAAKKAFLAIEARRAEIERQPPSPQRDVAIAKVKQEASDAANTVHFYNSTIRQTLDLSFKPPASATPSPSPAATKKE
jgi:tetratricopeptide (TPR) repeat protein